jgi:hypothetical protein
MRGNGACCSSAASICFWFVVSVLAWGFLCVLGRYWHLLRRYPASTILLAAAVGCIANWIKNRTLHCGITAPLFFTAGILFLLTDAGIVQVNARAVWPFVLVGTCIAFLLEWKYAKGSSFSGQFNDVVRWSPASSFACTYPDCPLNGPGFAVNDHGHSRSQDPKVAFARFLSMLTPLRKKTGLPFSSIKTREYLFTEIAKQ